MENNINRVKNSRIERRIHYLIGIRLTKNYYYKCFPTWDSMSTSVRKKRINVVIKAFENEIDALYDLYLSGISTRKEYLSSSEPILKRIGYLENIIQCECI